MRCAPRARKGGPRSPTRWQLARGCPTWRVSGCDSEHIRATRASAASSRIRSTPRASSAGGATERSEFQIPFLPRHAKHEGWAAFQTDPRAARLRARVLGFEEP